MTKFKVGDRVIADGDEAVVTEILPAADSDFDKTVSYAVEWIIESEFTQSEWGTFFEDELAAAGDGMNERIKELAEQATKHYPATETSGEFSTFDKEKFAELIVRECVNYINERTLDWDAELRWIFNDGSGDMAVDVDDLLNRHFGVEE